MQFFGFVFVVWFILKIIGVVETSWLWVFSPIWLPITVYLLFGLMGEIIKGIDSRISSVQRKKRALNDFLGKLHYAIARYGPDSKEVILLVDAHNKYREQSDKLRDRARRNA